MSLVTKASPGDFMGLFGGQADALPPDWNTRGAWLERAEDIAAFLSAFEGSLPDTEAFLTLLRVGGLLVAMAEGKR
jgi:hypothetical protein